MKLKSIFILLLAFYLQTVNAQGPSAYTAEAAYDLINTIEPSPFAHTTHPDAQWFPSAGMGLFMHWGIHSVAALDPSWAMIKNCFWVKRDCPIATEDYYRLAEDFDPVAYDPEKWVLAARQAGFQYMVLTAKHHDGYCLWPSKYGEWNTGKYMQGRDLLKPYVDACRKYGMKVGFYYSPRDWADPDYAHVFPFQDNDLNQKRVITLTPEESQQKFDHFFMTVIGQLSELLTRYGKIDVLWFDGVEWPRVNTYPDKVHAWLRTLQPGMVINPRWSTNGKGSFGDYKTEEGSWRGHLPEHPKKVNDGEWWEFCESWSGHWGYSPLDKYRSLDQVMKLLIYARSYGGNYLLNIGPAPDGTMRKGYYTECEKLANWMKNNKESVIGTQAVPKWKEMSKYPMTKTDQAYYVHLLNDTLNTIEITGIEKPNQAVWLDSGEKLSFKYLEGKKLLIDLNGERSHPLDAVIKIYSE
ncbi:MAG: hypothetical protein A2W90_03690 [Bacteroidetes bacterium GWF2_42_66]|nr:MAG: hypothetical protein A2W92_18610 [Bacteroidetes bacterium GWA2_42_15]OFY02568.1 MAG: hypothetical protein A2W89_22160 [Bacteroidetes bacterium GWE2_42_39]OFY41332.1 MAG: hypothetical protein A2W90_03690 [Bacteroidetes bacterium GWF2_42_66]HAZ04939.1 hypothetical protein [Marinilabiliales bacterium]HBL75470.1 hypothetical protein [Prolixibacteraceae bacterium]